jgi:hypothetical protein
MGSELIEHPQSRTGRPKSVLSCCEESLPRDALEVPLGGLDQALVVVRGDQIDTRQATPLEPAEEL